MDTNVNRMVNDFLIELRKLIDSRTAQQIHELVNGKKVEIHRGRWPNGHSKRTPEAIEKDRERLYACIKKHPGKRSEQLQELLDMEARELSLPLQQLLAKRRISAKGVARGRMYWAR